MCSFFEKKKKTDFTEFLADLSPSILDVRYNCYTHTHPTIRITHLHTFLPLAECVVLRGLEIEIAATATHTQTLCTYTYINTHTHANASAHAQTQMYRWNANIYG